MEIEKSPFVDPQAIRRYISRRNDELSQCSLALQNNDFGVLRETAHKILGNCKMFGFSDLQGIASRLHDSAVTKNSVNCTEALAQLRSWIEANSSLMSVNANTIATD